MTRPEKLQYGCYYHIYNRGNAGETLFREERNYRYFLTLYTKYIEPVAMTHAYCLLNNHYHFLIRIKDFSELHEEDAVVDPSQAFSNLFSTYTKAFNRAYSRTGSLFAKPFQRKRIDNRAYFHHLVVYIHQNPQKHGFVDNFREWPFSSYQAILFKQTTRIQRDTILSWFDGESLFVDAHNKTADEALIKPLIADDRL